MKLIAPVVIIIFISLQGCGQTNKIKLVNLGDITYGAEKTDNYLPFLENKQVAIVANNASRIGKTHLVDSLLKRSVNIVKIFSPEHGFRGKAQAGELVNSNIDKKTNLPIISLYGAHKKSTKEDLKGVDVVLFDLQDVGTRFFTYISTLSYMMEACAENGIQLIVLDRPNPNGFYVDGPVLEPSYSSFIGLHPVPIVYGMTMGEYGLMVNGENWLDGNLKCDLEIIQLEGYSRNMIVNLPVRPSPNLPNWKAIYLYPSLCLFEGTIMSEGRGTDYPFQIYGHPDFGIGSYVFIPEHIPGGGAHSKFEGVQCFGQNLTGFANNYQHNPTQLNLIWLIESYKLLTKKHDFFNDYFDKLAGTDQLRKQIEAGKPEKEIRESWQEDLMKFKKIRSKYLIYK